MTETLYDLDEIAKRLGEHIVSSASVRMPQPVLVTIWDGTMQWGNGFVWGYHADRTVQVLAPGPTDVSAATTTSPIIVWCFPPNPDDPGGYYIMIGASMNGVDGNRRPRITTTSITDENGADIGGSGSVTSVAMTVPSMLSVAGSPITTAGTLAVTLATQAANLIFGGPSAGGAAAPLRRPALPGLRAPWPRPPTPIPPPPRIRGS